MFIIEKSMNMTNKHGETPLHQAAKVGHTPAVKVLIEMGADVNVTDENGDTPLHIAAHRSYTEIIKLLIDADADVNRANEWGITPLRMALLGEDKDLLKQHGAK